MLGEITSVICHLNQFSDTINISPARNINFSRLFVCLPRLPSLKICFHHRKNICTVRRSGSSSPQPRERQHGEGGGRGASLTRSQEPRLQSSLQPPSSLQVYNMPDFNSTHKNMGERKSDLKRLKHFFPLTFAAFVFVA